MSLVEKERERSMISRVGKPLKGKEDAMDDLRLSSLNGASSETQEGRNLMLLCRQQQGPTGQQVTDAFCSKGSCRTKFLSGMTGIAMETT